MFGYGCAVWELRQPSLAGLMTRISHELTSLCSARYPLLQRIAVTADGQEPETPPGFIGLLLSVIEANTAQPLCVMLPSRGHVPRLTAVLLGLSRFLRSYDSHLRRIAEQELVRGSNVRVRPNDLVYQYLGVWDEYPDFFRLRTLPKGRQAIADRTLPLKEILRLEPTTRTSPRGSCESFDDVSSVPLDRLLEVTTFGNQALLSNEVLLVDGIDAFRRFADQISLEANAGSHGACVATAISGTITMGQIRVEGRKVGFVKDDGEAFGTGAPLIGITHSMERLAEYCTSAASSPSLVIVNGATRVASMQAFDDVAALQRVVVICDHQEDEAVRDLLNRGCRLWTFSALNMSVSVPSRRQLRAGVFDDMLQRAINAAGLNFESRVCSCPPLEEAARELATVQPDQISDHQSAFARAVRSVWGLINRLSGMGTPPSTDDRKMLILRIAEVEAAIRRESMWIPREAHGTLLMTCAKLREACEPAANLGLAKMDVIDGLLHEPDSGATLVVCHPDQVDELTRHVSASAASVAVCSHHSFPAESLFDRIILTSWLGSYNSLKVVRSYSASRLILAGYAFELGWLRQFARRLRRAPHVAELSGEDKQRVFQHLDGPKLDWAADEPVDPPIPPVDESWPTADSIESLAVRVRKGQPPASAQGADTVAARYMSFAGSSYAYLTANRRVPVATSIVRGEASRTQPVPERKADQLRRGDFVIFQEHGDTQVLRGIADTLLGTKARGLRELASRWRVPLRNSGCSPREFQLRAEGLNESRHILTIRNWFSDEEQIGPGSRDDLALISLVTANRALDAEADEVWKAILTLRGAHVSAGARLHDVLLHKLPSVVGEMEEGGTRVELDDVGSAWIVRVDAIAGEVELRHRSEVNRLLWDDAHSGEEQF
jgi:hypothetical protein